MAGENKQTKKFPSSRGNAASWHQIIMAATIAITGITIMITIIVYFFYSENNKELANQSIIQSTGNQTLPAGDYYIYRVFLDPALQTHYLVSSMKGGIVVSVAPPEKTLEPENIVAVSNYDSAAYVIRVDDDGSWNFLPTDVLKGILAKLHEIPDEATIQELYPEEQKLNQVVPTTRSDGLLSTPGRQHIHK